MNREIKFRAWDKNYMDRFRMKNNLDLNSAYFSQETLEGIVIMQFTGLKDKNGKEIYEGDIFGKFGGDTERPNEYEVHGKVYFDTDLSAFCVDSEGSWRYLHDWLDYRTSPVVSKDVIGNIYENPELIK